VEDTNAEAWKRESRASRDFRRGSEVDADDSGHEQEYLDVELELVALRERPGIQLQYQVDEYQVRCGEQHEENGHSLYLWRETRYPGGAGLEASGRYR
jgi:hypothetical protein